jgi:anti-sigma B factor antagonist
MTDVTHTLHLPVQHPHPGLALATVVGDVDVHTAPTLRSGALEIIQQGHPRLVLDLAPVGFCLAAVPDRLMRMLSMTGVDSLLPVHATTADAVAALTDSPPASANR